jgi:hypothetical protein
MAATPSDMCAHAAYELERLGPEPDTARERVQWREQRDNAAIKLAALADWNPALLAQAAALAAAEGDEATHQLLREVGDWTPRVSTGRSNAP